MSNIVLKWTWQGKEGYVAQNASPGYRFHIAGTCVWVDRFEVNNGKKQIYGYIGNETVINACFETYSN